MKWFNFQTFYTLHVFTFAARWRCFTNVPKQHEKKFITAKNALIFAANRNLASISYPFSFLYLLALVTALHLHFNAFQRGFSAFALLHSTSTSTPPHFLACLFKIEKQTRNNWLTVCKQARNTGESEKQRDWREGESERACWRLNWKIMFQSIIILFC